MSIEALKEIVEKAKQQVATDPNSPVTGALVSLGKLAEIIIDMLPKKAKPKAKAKKKKYKR